MSLRRAARLAVLAIAASAGTGTIAGAGAEAASAAGPRISADLPERVAIERPVVVLGQARRAPRGSRALLQERRPGRWVTRARSKVRRDGSVKLRWRRGPVRPRVLVRIVLVDRRGRTVARTRPATVRRAPSRPPKVTPAPAPEPAPGPAPAPAGSGPPAPPPAPAPTSAPAPAWPGHTPGGPQIVAPEAQRLHSLGADRWDVWTCGDVGGGTAQAAKHVLDTQIVPYFAWLSSGRYRPEFRARGALDGEDPAACGPEAQVRSAGRDGALIVQTDRVAADNDACADDLTRLDPCAGAPTVLPDNERLAWIGPDEIFGPSPRLSTVAHELGHALTWPHSFTGRLHIEFEGEEVGIEYDDPLDVMGYERLWGTGSWTSPVGGVYAFKATEAIGRISAGWVDDAAMTVHDRPSAVYVLGPLDRPGLQVIAIPTADPRAFLTLEARVNRPFDAVPGEGVVVHAVDQRPEACQTFGEEVAGCWGSVRRQSPAPNTPDSLDSLIADGGSVSVAGVRIAVTGRLGDHFAVRVDGARAAFALKPTLCLYVPAACGGGQGPLGP